MRFAFITGMAAATIYLALSACTPQENSPQEAQPTAEQRDYFDKLKTGTDESIGVINACDSRYKKGEFKTYLEKTVCANQAAISVFQKNNFPRMDAIEKVNTIRLEYAQKIDNKEITEEQARKEMSPEFSKIIMDAVPSSSPPDPVLTAKLAEINNHYKELRAQAERNLQEKLKEIDKKICRIHAHLRIGMTKKQVRSSCWGEPESANVTVGSFGRHEQWVYSSEAYVYFDNGKVSAIQYSQ